MVCSDTVLAFAHTGEEKILDSIPLVEIMGVQDMGGLGAADLDERAGRILLEIHVTEIISDTFFKKFFANMSDSHLDEKEKCRAIFDTIDTDKTGTCSREELTIFLKKLFCKPEEIEDFIKKADADLNGEQRLNVNI